MCSCQDRMSDDFDQRHIPLSTPIPHLYKPRKWEWECGKGVYALTQQPILILWYLALLWLQADSLFFSCSIPGQFTVQMNTRRWRSASITDDELTLSHNLVNALSYLGWRTRKSADQNHDWLIYWLIDWIIYLLKYGLTTLNKPKPRKNHHTKYFQCGRFNL